MVDTDAIPTPHLTPEEWRELSKGDVWRSPFGEPGHCHNLLDEWADALDVLREENTRLRAALARCDVWMTSGELSSGTVQCGKPRGHEGRGDPLHEFDTSPARD